MATVGLYDVDFLHGGVFNLNIPLMKAYKRLYDEGHNVIMMKPYEKTGRFNKVYYFKDNPNLILPKGVVIDTDKSKFYGYGFLKESGLSDETKLVPPSFVPYELLSNKLKNQALFKSIKTNSLIDWREKDFTGFYKGKGITYVNDRDFLDEPDWRDIFKAFDNNIEFVRSIRPRTYDEAIEYLTLYQGNKSIILPNIYMGEQYKELIKRGKVDFTYVKDEDLFMYTFAAKVMGVKSPHFYRIPISDFEKDLLSWSNVGNISFKDWKGADFNPSLYLNFKYRLLLKQDPTKMTYNDLKANWLT